MKWEAVAGDGGVGGGRWPILLQPARERKRQVQKRNEYGTYDCAKVALCKAGGAVATRTAGKGDKRTDETGCG